MKRDGYELLRQELFAGERLLWVGRPRQGVFLPRVDAAGIAIVLIYLVLPGALLVYAVADAAFFVGFVALLFLAGAVQRGVSNFVLDPFRRRHLYYGLTGQRAIVVSTKGDGETKTVRISAMTEIALLQLGAHTGTIVCMCVRDGWFRRNRHGQFKRSPLFRYIVDARHVFNLILEVNPALAAPAPVQ